MTIYQEVAEKMLYSKNPLIILAPSMGLDIPMSGLVMKKIFESQGKKTQIVMPVESLSYKEHYALDGILSEINDIEAVDTWNQKVVINLDVSKTKIHEFSYEIQNGQLKIHLTTSGSYFAAGSITTEYVNPFDLVIILGAQSLNDLGNFYNTQFKFLSSTPIINIDIDEANTRFGTINMVDNNATAVSEIVYGLMCDVTNTSKNILDEKIATMLLAGLIHKTTYFKTGNVTSKALDMGSKLIAAKAKKDEIVKTLYQYTAETLKISGKILANIIHDKDYKLIFSSISRDDIWPYKLEPSNVIKVIADFVAFIKDVDSFVLFYEDSPSVIQCYIKTSKSVNFTDFGKAVTYGGSSGLVSYTISGIELDEAQASVLEAIREKAVTVISCPV